MDILNQSAFDIDLNLDPLWCAWFSGWIDGEGCFTATINKDNSNISCVLVVAARDDDAGLFNGVEGILKCGSIIMRPQRKTSNPCIVWRCVNISACRHVLIPILDKYPLRSKKHRDYEIWRKLVFCVSDGHHRGEGRDYALDLYRELRDIKGYVAPPPTDAPRSNFRADEFWHSWFSGWIDGEGCFMAIPRRNNNTAIECGLSVGVRDDDFLMIFGVRDTLKCGIISRNHAYGIHNPSIRWRCGDIKGCREIIIPILDRYPLRSKKRRDYDIWRKIVTAISCGHHLNGNRNYILDLCQQLKDIKGYIPSTREIV